MKQSIYIFSDTILRRRDNSIQYEKISENIANDEEELEEDEAILGEEKILYGEEKKFIPIEQVESIFSFGTLRFNSRFLYLMSRHHIPIHFYGRNGYYAGTFLPEKEIEDGKVLIQQINYYQDNNKRMEIAREFIRGAIHNELCVLKYHNLRTTQLKEEIDFLSEVKDALEMVEDINKLMGLEGMAKKVYYSTWKKIINQQISFSKREKHPPNNTINALISYGNVVLYSITLNEIYKTKLYPQVGYLHQPGNRHPLSFDIAEIFKPLIIDRIIIKLFNKNIISEKNGKAKDGVCLLDKNTKRILVDEINTKMNTTINEAGRENNISYKRLIRDECYKLIKHLNNEEKYNSFKSRW